MSASTRPPTRAPVTEEALKNVVLIGNAVYTQPESGPPQLLISAEELDARKMTQQRWIDERKQELGIGGRF